MKIVESEVDFRELHSNDWTNLATQLDLNLSALGLSSVKISAQSVQYLDPHLAQEEQEQEEEETNMPPKMNPKTAPGFSKK